MWGQVPVGSGELSCDFPAEQTVAQRLAARLLPPRRRAGRDLLMVFESAAVLLQNEVRHPRVDIVSDRELSAAVNLQPLDYP